MKPDPTIQAPTPACRTARNWEMFAGHALAAAPREIREWAQKAFYSGALLTLTEMIDPDISENAAEELKHELNAWFSLLGRSVGGSA